MGRVNSIKGKWWVGTILLMLKQWAGTILLKVKWWAGKILLKVNGGPVQFY